MGTTVTTGKAVKAFRTKTDKVIYVLFEEAYEKVWIKYMFKVI